jgi:glycine cleavage system H protein
MTASATPDAPLISPTREWVHSEAGIVTLGASAQILAELGEITGLELPELGKFLEIGQSAAVLESAKTCCDVYSPVTGKVIATNSALQCDLRPLNHDPDAAWLVRILPDPPPQPDEFHPVI